MAVLNVQNWSVEQVVDWITGTNFLSRLLRTITVLQRNFAPQFLYCTANHHGDLLHIKSIKKCGAHNSSSE